MPKFLDAAGNEIPFESLKIGADASDMDINSYASALGYKAVQGPDPVEGKENGSAETTPSLSPDMPAGDSSSGDISSESPKTERVGIYIYRGQKQAISESEYLKDFAGKDGYPDTLDEYIKRWKGNIEESTILDEVNVESTYEGKAKTYKDLAAKLDKTLAEENEFKNRVESASQYFNLEDRNGDGVLTPKITREEYFPEIPNSGGRRTGWSEYVNDYETDLKLSLGEEKYNKWKELSEAAGGNVTAETLKKFYNDINVDAATVDNVVNSAKVRKAELFYRDVDEETQLEIQRFRGSEDYQQKTQEVYLKHVQDERDYEALTNRPLVSPQVVNGRRYVPTTYADYSSVLKEEEKSLKTEYKNIEAQSADLENRWADIVTQNEAYSAQLDDIKKQMEFYEVMPSLPPTQAEAYNNLVEEYNAVISSKDFALFAKNWESLAAETEALRGNIENATNKYSNILDQKISVEAAMKSYESLDRLAIVWEEFILGSFMGLTGGVAGVASEVAKWKGDELLAYQFEQSKRISVDYNKKLEEKRKRLLPQDLRIGDIGEGVGFTDWLGESLINNSPSILIAMAPTGVAGIGLKGAARMKAIYNASKVTSAVFGAAEAGGYLREMDLAQLNAPETLKMLREELNIAEGLTDRKEIEAQIKAQENILSLSETQKAFNAAAYGAIATYAERLGSLSYMRKFDDLAKGIGIKNFLGLKNKAIDRIVSKNLSALTASGIGAVTELGEEAITLLGENITDIAIAGENKSIFEGLDADFVANVLVSSFAMTGPKVGSTMYNSVAGEFRTASEIKSNRDKVERLVEIEDKINSYSLPIKERLELHRKRNELLHELALDDAKSLMKVNRLDKEDIQNVAELRRQMREIRNEAAALGQGSLDASSLKELENLKQKYSDANNAAETILRKSEEAAKEATKDAVNKAEAAFNYSNYLFNMDVAKTISKDVVSANSVDEINALELTEAEKALAIDAFEQGHNATVTSSGKIVLFEANALAYMNLVGGTAAQMAAVSPLHEIGHRKVKELGIVDDETTIEAAKNVIDELITFVSSQRQIGKLSQGKFDDFMQRLEAYRDIAKASTKYENQYLETNFIDVDELIQLVTDFTNAGLLQKSSFGALHGIKNFVNRAMDLATDGNGMFFRAKTGADVLNFISHWTTKAKETGTLQLPDDEKIAAAKASISNQAEKAKQVLEKVSANMAYFDPNSPLIGRVLPGMVQAQLASYMNKGLKIDLEEAVSDVIMRLYVGNDIGKFDGRGSLYGYLNGRIKYRILDAFKNNDAIVEDFNTGDLDDVKGVAAMEVSIGVSEERIEAERPQYKNLLERKVLNEEQHAEALNALPRIVGTLKSRIDEPVSKNRTVTPIVAEMRAAFGKHLDIVFKTAMGGKKDGQLRKWLVANKKAILENMTTTYLMQAMPIAVQKKVDGVWTSEWEGKKIDRETTSVDMAGRTSGAEMVRRLPQASLKISDKEFLSYILDETGNPIRGRKESLAKALGEEYAFDLINAEMQNPDSKIRQVLETNQERLGVELADNYVQNLALQIERGNVKFSIGIATLRNKSFNEKFRTAVKFTQDQLANGLSIEEIIDSEGNFLNTYANGEPVKIRTQAKKVDGKQWTIVYTSEDLNPANEDNFTINDISSLVLLVHEKGLLYNANQAAFLIGAKTSDVIAEWVASRNSVVPNGLSKASIDKKIKYELDARVMLEALGKEVHEVLGHQIFGYGSILDVGRGRYEVGRFGNELYETIENLKPSSLPSGLDLSKVEKLYNSKKYGIIYEIGTILNDENLNAEQKRAAFEESGLKQRIEQANIHNRLLAKHVAKTLITLVKDGRISAESFIQFLQMQTDIGLGFRALATLDYITFTDEAIEDLKIEHITPNSEVMSSLLNIAATEYATAHALDLAIENAFSTNNGWLENKRTLDVVDALGTLNTKKEARMYATGMENFNNIWHISGVPASEMLSRELEANANARKTFTDWMAYSESVDTMKVSAKASIGVPQVIFMVGGPGAGKSSVIKGTGLLDKGWRVVNQDISLEQMKIEEGLPADEKIYDKEQRSLRAKIGHKARKIAEEKLGKYKDRRENIIVDGTGASFNATRKKMAALEEAGYKVHVLFVNTSKDVAVARNQARKERSLADFIVTKTWDSVQESSIKYKEEFGENVYEINTDNLEYGQKLPKDFMDKVNNGIEAPVAKYSIGLSDAFNQMLERNKGVSSTKVYSSVQAKMLGEKKGKYRIFVPASAEDFRGLTSYTFAGKGEQGEADQKFFEEKLINPYVRGVAQIDAVKQQIRREYHAVAKAHRTAYKMLGKKITNSSYTYDQALRVYMWTNQGIEIPGMDKDDVAFLINEIKQFPQLIELGNAMQTISRQDTWIEPNEYWMSHTLISELNSMTEKVGRRKYLAEFIENSEAIFSPENLNKIEAVYGTRHKEALQDSLYSMINGRNRPAGTTKQVNQWLNWVNNSTGAIMFFNVRSAVLQTLSATNFINWSDNNPIKAAAAFANQKQYWSDFAMIFNSDKLKQRRSGLQTDVNEAEIANMADGAQNKAAAVVTYLLKIGFTPTQIADSFAIAMGGASFYRNRVNTYLKQGMSQADAEAKAFEDFGKTADEAQQSSDPYLVSQQQRSVLGRLVLAFQNTPMQYTRLMKKAMQDLANGRGDAKTNISKIIYYGAVQNFIFSALQTALFAAIPGFDDDDEELSEKELEKLQRKEDLKILRILNSMTDSILKGSGVAGAVLATIKNTVTEYFVQKEKGFMFDRASVLLQVASLSPPIGSKLRKINSAMSGEIFGKDVLEARGFEVTKDGRINLSPAYSILGNLVSATTNVPMDRMVDLINGYSEALDSRNSTWQRIALSLGWKTWDVGAKNEEDDLIKIDAKAKRKEEGKKKAKTTQEAKKAEQKAIDAAATANMTPDERAAYYRMKKNNK